MNYWAAELSNLDVTRSLFDYIEVVGLLIYAILG
jgi:hypothetical protein